MKTTKEIKKKLDEKLLSKYFVSSDTRYNFFKNNEGEKKLLLLDIHTPDLETIIHYDLKEMPEFNLENLDENIVVHLVYDLAGHDSYRGQQLDINTDMRSDSTVYMEQYILDYSFDKNMTKNFSGSSYGRIQKTFTNNNEFKLYLQELVSKNT